MKRLGRIDGGAGKRAFATQRRQRYNPTRTDLDGTRRRFLGYEYVHVCVADYSRLGAEVLADEKSVTAIAFLRRAVTFFASRGIQVERVLTDNGSAYVSAIHALLPSAWASSTAEPAPTDHKPTAKQNASSAP